MNSSILNWKSFNISKDGTVIFNQPDASSVVLNRIFQADPSRIAGALQSNGRIYLLNQNGIIFAEGAQVNVGGLLASSLDFSPAALQNGLTLAGTSPALQPFVDANGNPVLGGPVRVEAGASLNSTKGQIFLFAPEVANAGNISTPDGQTILAAGQRIFLLASTDPNLRGLFVEVGDGGTVTNGDTFTGAASSTVAKISADRGNVTLAGAIVRQAGAISATTSVRANGSIRLQARDTERQELASNPTQFLTAERGGELELAAGSTTSVTLDSSSTETTVDVNAQPQSSVDLAGKKIRIDAGAQVRATAGRITAVAATSPSPDFSATQSPRRRTTACCPSPMAPSSMSRAQVCNWPWNAIPCESNCAAVSSPTVRCNAMDRCARSRFMWTCATTARGLMAPPGRERRWRMFPATYPTFAATCRSTI